MRKFWKTEGWWHRICGEALRGPGRAQRGGEMSLGELGFVWAWCEGEEEPGSCEGARFIRRVRMSRSLG